MKMKMELKGYGKMEDDEGVEMELVLIDYRRGEVNKFVISGVIGKAVDGSRVYKAEWEASWNDEIQMSMTAAMRFAKVSDTVEFERLKSGVDAYDSVGSRAHLVHDFKAFYYKEYYCFPFPYMKHGSLLTLMADRFPSGLPEPCIIHLLYRLLQILKPLRVSHTQICAAHVYLVQLPSGLIDIVLGYGATLHHLQTHDSSSSYKGYPASTCIWAAPPQLHSTHVWLLGITALELAYGTLHFCSQPDLDSLISNIHHQNQLPNKLDHEERWRWLKDHAHALPSSLNTNKRPRFPKERLHFSKPFIRFLADCLHFNPRKTPQVFQLLRYRLFDQVRDTTPLINLSPYYDHAQWMIRNNISGDAALFDDEALMSTWPWSRMQYRKLITTST